MLRGDAEFGNLDPKESTVNTLSLLAVPRLVDLACVPKEVDDPPDEEEDTSLDEVIEPLLKNPGEPTVA